jgi:hypothetical protein
MKVARWLQHDVLDGLFVQSTGNDAEQCGDIRNWLKECGNAFYLHDDVFSSTM